MARAASFIHFHPSLANMTAIISASIHPRPITETEKYQCSFSFPCLFLDFHPSFLFLVLLLLDHATIPQLMAFFQYINIFMAAVTSIPSICISVV